MVDEAQPYFNTTLRLVSLHHILYTHHWCALLSLLVYDGMRGGWHAEPVPNTMLIASRTGYVLCLYVCLFEWRRNEDMLCGILYMMFCDVEYSALVQRI